MDRTKFVLLQEPIAATEAANLLCHVVASKTSPQLAHAPFNADNTPVHSTTPLAVPKCHASLKLGSFMAIAADQGVGDRVSRLLNLNGLYADELRVLEECRSVKRYVLDSPQPAFQELMTSEKYSMEVCGLLERSLQRQGYLITGFLTATDDSWLIGATPKELHQSDNAPFSWGDGVAVPVPFLYDDVIGMELAMIAEHCPEPSHFSNEQIFAISYKTVTLPWGQSPFARHISPTPAIARPRRSNAYHLASSRADETWVHQQASRALHASAELLTVEEEQRLADYVSDDDLFIYI